jgi:hypothetical protein
MSTIENESPGPVQPPVIDLDAEEVGGAGETDPPPPGPDRIPGEPAARKPAPWRGILFTVAAVLAAILGSLFYRSYGERFWPSTERVTLEERVNTLEAANRTAATQLQALASALDGVKSATAQATGDLASRLATTETALKSLQDSLGPATPGSDPALAARVDALEKAVAELKSAPPPQPPPTEPGKGAELASALSGLQSKFADGAPYKDELAVVSLRVPEAPGLPELARHADLGIPNAEGLAVDLEAAAAALGDTSPAAEETSAGMWGSVVSLLGSVIKVRTLGDADWKASAAEAVALARRGDLRAALARLSVEEADMPPTLTQWRDRGAARLAAEAALESVTAATLRVIATANRT